MGPSQLPLAQNALGRQPPGWPQSVLSATLVISHVFDAGLQVLRKHALSPPVGQSFTVAGLTLQSHFALFGWLRSQNSVPLQALPSSLLLQSSSWTHLHWFLPAAQPPLTQMSPAVHGLLSSHAPSSLRAVILQLPVLGSHLLAAQALSSTVWQCTMVAGLSSHVLPWLPFLQ